MKLVFPTDDANNLQSIRSQHFGKATYYTVVTINDDDSQEVKSIKNEQNENHSCANSANIILSLNADALVVGGIGGRPASIFQKAGLDVFIDKQSTTIHESLNLYLLNKLVKINGIGTCNHH